MNRLNKQITNHIVLLGDSIFDNALYVDPNDSVIEQLQINLAKDCQATLLAADGNITTEVYAQLELIPADTTHAFLSIGGNDALRVVDVLQQSIVTVGDAMEIFTEIRLDFQQRYRELIMQVKQKVDQLIICTIHDCVPGIEPKALTALSLFNEIILKEAISIGASIIDLRILNNDKDDYSVVSPIEPSQQGGKKIVEQMIKIIELHDYKNLNSLIYSG